MELLHDLGLFLFELLVSDPALSALLLDLEFEELGGLIESVDDAVLLSDLDLLVLVLSDHLLVAIGLGLGGVEVLSEVLFEVLVILVDLLGELVPHLVQVLSVLVLGLHLVAVELRPHFG